MLSGGGVAASFLVAGLMLTPAPFSAFAEPAASEVEQSARDEQAAESEEANQEPTVPQVDAPKAAAETQDPVVEKDALDTVYVASYGDDMANEGNSKDSPLASLAMAVWAARDDATIYVVDNISVHETARYFDKHLTITSDGATPVTVTRSEDFKQIQDTARSTYNGALIEAGSDATGVVKASLTLKNIILDDAGIHETNTFDKDGKQIAYFTQASGSDGNTKYLISENKEHPDQNVYATISNQAIVQDAMVATYNGTANITLGDGAMLKNFGGMSAVRMSGGTLTMKSGSKIVDDSILDRIKGATIKADNGRTADKNTYGPAGALWIQGGTVVMERGSEISGIVGRAIYEDSGNVTVNGTISNIQGDGDMWWGLGGSAAHVRNSATFTLGNDGVIHNISGASIGKTGVVVEAVSGKLSLAGLIEKCTDVNNVVHVSGSRDNLKGSLTGTIQDCTATTTSNGYIVAVETSDFDISGTIQRCRANVAPIYANTGALINLYGTLADNAGGQAGAIYLYSQYSNERNVVVNMCEGSKVTRNERTTKDVGDFNGFDRFKDRGIICSGGSNREKTTSIFNLKGGEISDNKSVALVIRKEGQANMSGGKIANNASDAVEVESSEKDHTDGFFVMSGGEISGNKGVGVSVSFGYRNYVQLLGGTIQNNGSFHQVSARYGQANDTNERVRISSDVIKGNTTVKLDFGEVTLDSDYAEIWLGSPKTAAKNKIKELVKAEHADWDKFGSSALWFKPTTDKLHFTVSGASVKKTGLFVAYIPLKANGMPADNAEVTIKEVKNEPTVNVSLESLEPNTSYALMFVNNNEYTLKPDATTVYVGGENKEGATGFPEFTLLDSIDKTYGKCTVQDGDTTQEYKNFDAMMAALHDMLQVTYVDKGGKEVADDSKSGAYAARLTWKDGKNHTVRINGNDVKGFADGSLIVRHVSDTKAARAGENVVPVVKDEPTAAVDKATATKNSSYYLNGNSNFRVANTDGIALMDDDALIEDSAVREQALEEKTKDALPNLAANQAYRYDFHFLDLVDTNNGNAYVTPSSDETVYLPYPEGTDQTADFQLVHLNGLNREYGINGQANIDEAIAASTAKVMQVEKTAAGIKFSMPKGDFGLYALAWKTNAYTITATAGDGGAIDPAGAVTVAKGTDKTFAITPNAGYKISDVKVDGESVGAVSSYTFKNVTTDHTIEATFTADSVTPPAHTHTWSDWKHDDDEHWRECTVCGKITDKAAHTWGDWTVVTEATDTTDGLRERVCTVCGHKVQEIIPATGENPDDKPDPDDKPNPDDKPEPDDKPTPDNPSDGKPDGKPGNGTDNKAEGGAGSEGELPATGDSSNSAVILAATGAAATLAGAVILHRREQR